jgi:hypothetical protein
MKKSGSGFLRNRFSPATSYVGLTGFEPAPLDPQEVAEKAFSRSPEFVVADAHYVTFRDAQVVQHRA